jgi:hypothetical protein
MVKSFKARELLFPKALKFFLLCKPACKGGKCVLIGKGDLKWLK